MVIQYDFDCVFTFLLCISFSYFLIFGVCLFRFVKGGGIVVY